jgi:membrane-associated protease RseP (regulator of RpoE activity)
MDKWIFSHKKILYVIGTIGVIIGLVASVGGLGAILYFTTQNQQAVSPILPTVGDFQYPTGVIGVPFWFWLVGIFVILTVHEPMHAIFSRLAGIPVRSWGIMTFFVLPIGAFVDPDMKKIYKLNLMQKLRIFAGGSLGNFATGALMLLVLIFVANYFFGQFTIPGTPAAAAGLEGTLQTVNGVEVRDVNDLGAVLSELPPGSTVEAVTDRGSYTVVTEARPDGEGSYMGIGFGLKPEYNDWSGAILTIHQLFFWLFIFNVGVGVANMLPMKPFDGGHMFEAIFAKFFKNDRLARTAIHITSVVVLVIILVNIFGSNILGSLV